MRQRIAILEQSGAHSHLISSMRSEIKRFCISSEIFFTLEAAEQGCGDFLYSCSSLVDHGIQAYAKDDGWQLLLSIMGQVACSSDANFVRTFFIDTSAQISEKDLIMFSKIIRKHLVNNVSVALVSTELLVGDLAQKYNMAIFGRSQILSATNQIVWDLGLSGSKQEIYLGIEKHHYYTQKRLVHFNRGDEKLLIPKLREVLKVTEE